MGDVVGLMKDFQEVVDEKDATEKAMKMLEEESSPSTTSSSRSG